MTAASHRNRMIAKLHVLKKEHALDDGTYRDKLERVTGHRSASDCDDAQLEKAVQAFHMKQNQNNSYTRKVKALWISAFLLGELVDGTDAALDAFVARQTGKLKLQFVTPAEANKITEGLKAVCARAGFVPPINDKGGIEARRALLRAQWQVLAGMGAVRVTHEWGLDGWIEKKYLAFRGGLINLTAPQMDTAAKALGYWIRQEQKKRGDRASA